MAFCINCGEEMTDNAKFCSECGEKAYVKKIDDKSKRKVAYDGEVKKCPNCGEILKSFKSRCLACDWEIRATEPSNAIQQFALKLERIESKEMPPFEPKKSLMKSVFGRDFKDEDEYEEARSEFEESKKSEKANLISNFPVPNTKEDILEFMLLSSSNIDVKNGIDDDISRAWLKKMEQLYKRSEITLKNTQDFILIKEIYDNKKQEIKDKRKRTIIIILVCIIGWFMLMGLLALME